MKKYMDRLLTFVIGVPAAVSIILFMPQKNHLAANITAIILSALGAMEFAEILKKKNNAIGSTEAAILGISNPLAMTLAVSFDINLPVLPIIAASWLLISRVFASEEDLKGAANRIAAGFAVIAYPGLFMTWIIRMTRLPEAETALLIFLLLVFANDSAAWAAGLLFGKGSRGVIKASPNKSLAGFAGGIAASTLIGLGAVYVLPEVFTSQSFPSPLAGLVVGFLSATAATLGDLGESVLKRSSNIKDSGHLIPGRGGVLDSIDSLCLAAPVYYGSYCFFFTQ
ncbi:MAG: phosphatidate cytidylyltransferase [Spirochaetaceae bacterium]|jgi:phosphatidate cytidylyltransferase|nr:phosphatidate cytidylyltransferase [Spirochaetaceae bacterium]